MKSRAKVKAIIKPKLQIQLPPKDKDKTIPEVEITKTLEVRSMRIGQAHSLQHTMYIHENEWCLVLGFSPGPDSYQIRLSKFVLFSRSWKRRKRQKKERKKKRTRKKKNWKKKSIMMKRISM